MKKKWILLILVLVLVVLVGLILSCALFSYAVPDSDSFDTYPKFLDYAENFSKHLNSRLTGIFFNLDNESSVLNKTYYANYARTKYYFLDFYKPISYSWGMNFSLSFYMADTERSDNDPQYAYFIQVDSISRIPDNMNIDGEIEYITATDVNELSSHTDGLGNYFNYSTLFQINIDNTYAGHVRIWSVNEITEEKIDEIYRILLDNMIIYK